MRTRTLLSQVLAVNTGLVAATALVAAALAPVRASGVASPSRALLIVLAVAGAVFANSLLLRKRLDPLDRLHDTMDRVDLHSPGQRACAPENAPREIERLTADFNRMLERLEEERREAGRAVLRAQEEERARIAQDLHDEVNQALTAILLRLQAAALDVPHGLRSELQGDPAPGHAGHGGAAHARPPAAPDRARRPRPRAGARVPGLRLRRAHGHPDELPPPRRSAAAVDEEQLVLYRVTQESLSNVVQHSGASSVRVELSAIGRTVLRVRDDGCGFAVPAHGEPRNSLGVSGMRERALLVGGRLNVFSAPGEGTTIELTMGAS